MKNARCQLKNNKRILIGKIIEKTNKKLMDRTEKQCHGLKSDAMNSIKNYLILLSGLLVVMILGYTGFWYFATQSNLPNAYGLYAFAMIAGVASFFSPCSFGLLPAYLTYYRTVQQPTREKSLIQALLRGIWPALGLITFNIVLTILLLGIGTSIGNAFSVSANGNLSHATLAIRGIIGMALFGLGLVQLLHVKIISEFFHKIAQIAFNIQGERGTRLGLYVYGFVYNLGNIGCTGPILSGLILVGLASTPLNTAIAFIIYSVVMGLLMFGISIAIEFANEKTIGSINQQTPAIQKMGAWVLAIVGLFILGSVLFSQTFVKLFFP